MPGEVVALGLMEVVEVSGVNGVITPMALELWGFRCWLRYSDDVFCVVNGSRSLADIPLFTEDLNRMLGCMWRLKLEAAP